MRRAIATVSWAHRWSLRALFDIEALPQRRRINSVDVGAERKEPGPSASRADLERRLGALNAHAQRRADRGYSSASTPRARWQELNNAREIAARARTTQWRIADRHLLMSFGGTF